MGSMPFEMRNYTFDSSIWIKKKKSLQGPQGWKWKGEVTGVLIDGPFLLNEIKKNGSFPCNGSDRVSFRENDVARHNVT